MYQCYGSVVPLNVSYCTVDLAISAYTFFFFPCKSRNFTFSFFQPLQELSGIIPTLSEPLSPKVRSTCVG